MAIQSFLTGEIFGIGALSRKQLCFRVRVGVNGNTFLVKRVFEPV